MSEMKIRSRFREYTVSFVDDSSVPVRAEMERGAFAVVDKTVFELYRPRLAPLLGDRLLVVEANETNKTLAKCQEIIELLVERRLRRDQRIVAIGGGVIQDVSAFAASILYRGIEWSFFPTTLLAQADSCIGSKTSINLGDKKNLIGNFYPPSAIYVDSAFLTSLSVDDIKSGIGEMLHFFFYADSPLIGKMMGHYDQLLADRALLGEYIKASLAIKKSVIEVDELDKGERNKFNYGHTFGHALETVTDYRIKHGQAVTVGMDLANFLSLRLGLLDQRRFDEMHHTLLTNFPVYDFRTLQIGKYLDALSKDKKNVGDDLVCILSEGPGKLVKKRLPFDAELKDAVAAFFDQQLSCSAKS